MPLITPNAAVAFIDKFTAVYNCVFGTSASGFGLGDGTFGASLKASNMRNILEGSASSYFQDADLGSILDTPALSLLNSNLATTFFSGTWGSMLNNFNTLGSRASSVSTTINNFDSFMYWYNYLNGSSYWQCLAPPDYYWAYQAATNLASVPNKKNLYYEILQGVTYRGTTFTNAMAKFVVTGAGAGTTTLGNNVPSTHAGGYAWVNITTAITGSGLLTVVGTNQDGNAETWTVTLTGSTALQLTPQTYSYSLISTVTTVSIAAGVTAGTFYIEARKPSGRSNPPA